MLSLKPLDETCPIHQQLGADVSPVILGNLLTVAALLQAWEVDANWMKQQDDMLVFRRVNVVVQLVGCGRSRAKQKGRVLADAPH